MTAHLISMMIGFPFLGAIIQALVSRRVSQSVALGAGLLGSLCGIIAVSTLTPELAGLSGPAAHLAQVVSWVGAYSINYEVAIDGINALPVLLVCILFPVLLLSEWPKPERGFAGYPGVQGVQGLFLILQSVLTGLLCSQNLFLIFFFWVLSAVPIYFLIAIWGDDQREKAAFRFLITATTANAFFFVMLLLVYYTADPHSFSLSALEGGKLGGAQVEILGNTVSVAALSFLFLCLGFVLRVPVWPFHGWFTYLSTQAPAAVCVILGGAFFTSALTVFTKLSFQLFPRELQNYSSVIMVFGAVNLIFGSIGAVAQKELRRFLAFVAMAELGFLLMGVGSRDSAGVAGALYQGLTAGLALASMGIFAGLIRRRANHNRLGPDQTPAIQGLAVTAPVLAVFAAVFFAAIIGVPGLGPFVGQSLITMGGYAVYPATMGVVAVGVIFLTYGVFAVYRSIFLGEGALKNSDSSGKWELSGWERATLLPLLAGLMVFGIYPKPLLDLVRPAVEHLLGLITSGAGS